jgi:hypothetical protein
MPDIARGNHTLFQETDMTETTTKSRPAKKKGRRRRQGSKNSNTTFFRKLFTSYPQLLEQRDNTEIINFWKQENPGQEFTNSIRGLLSNLKCVLRKQDGMARATARSADISHQSTNGNGAMKVRRNIMQQRQSAKSVAVLEALEVQIDQCLTLIAANNCKDLQDVETQLRVARRQLGAQIMAAQ